MSFFLFLLVSEVGCGFCLWLFLDFFVYLFDVTTAIKSRLSNNNNMLQNFEKRDERDNSNDQEDISSNKYEM